MKPTLFDVATSMTITQSTAHVDCVFHVCYVYLLTSGFRKYLLHHVVLVNHRVTGILFCCSITSPSKNVFNLLMRELGDRVVKFDFVFVCENGGRLTANFPKYILVRCSFLFFTRSLKCLIIFMFFRKCQKNLKWLWKIYWLIYFTSTVLKYFLS